jgi:hypothetical protein
VNIKMPLLSIFRRGIEIVLEDSILLKEQRNDIGYHILTLYQHIDFM